MMRHAIFKNHPFGPDNRHVIKPVPLKKIYHLHADTKKYARVANLIYVTDSEPGITRMKKGKGFIYLYDNKPVNDLGEIARIRSLVIPPAWKNVWICTLHNGHLQATGIDARNRKQYRYHPLWNKLRNETKFHRMLDFGLKLPALRQRVQEDISRPGLTMQKVIATVISLMERTYIRIGNSAYEKENGSYGITTLRDQHVQIEGSSIRFTFKGKRGIEHTITLRNKRLARIVKQCRDIPGRELFQYIDENGVRHCIDSGKVNAYIKEVTGEDFSAKDFRTWAGTLTALQAFRKLGEAQTKGNAKANIVEVLDHVSRQLGNTRAVCRKYYVHPVLITLYENNSLGEYISELDEVEREESGTALTAEENILMKILSA